MSAGTPAPPPTPGDPRRDAALHEAAIAALLMPLADAAARAAARPKLRALLHLTAALAGQPGGEPARWALAAHFAWSQRAAPPAGRGDPAAPLWVVGRDRVLWVGWRPGAEIDADPEDAAFGWVGFDLTDGRLTAVADFAAATADQDRLECCRLARIGERLTPEEI